MAVGMASCASPTFVATGYVARICLPLSVSCSMAPQQKSRSIKVIINGACSSLGRAAICAITKARGMELAGAVDSSSIGMDAGEVAGLEEPLELPISHDLVMVLNSLSQGSPLGVMVDLSDGSRAYENVRQATAFGLRSVVAVENLDMDKVGALSTFCDKASMGCVVAPSLSIGAVLLQQAANTAAFHYKQAEIVESQSNAKVFPSVEATQLAEAISGLGQEYNKSDTPVDFPARGAKAGDGVRIHSLALPGVLSSLAIHFSGPGEVLTFQHDLTDTQALIPGLLVAIRRVVRLTSLVYGLEKIL